MGLSWGSIFHSAGIHTLHHRMHGLLLIPGLDPKPKPGASDPVVLSP